VFDKDEKLTADKEGPEKMSTSSLLNCFITVIFHSNYQAAKLHLASVYHLWNNRTIEEEEMNCMI